MRDDIMEGYVWDAVKALESIAESLKHPTILVINGPLTPEDVETIKEAVRR